MIEQQSRRDLLNDLASRLRNLVERSVGTKAELKAHIKASLSCARWIESNPDLVEVTPEFVWHYLADSDIRFKSQLYAHDQNLEIMEFVWKVERGDFDDLAPIRHDNTEPRY